MESLTPELAEILGLLCAEGCHIVSYTNHWESERGKLRYRMNKKSERIEFYNKDMKLLLHYKKLLSKEFSYIPNITKDNKINIGKRNVIKHIINYTDLGNLRWRVPSLVDNSSMSVQIAFLRGYFDGDGTASNRVRMFSVNKTGLNQVSKLLKNLKVKHTMQGPIFKKNRKPSYIIQISETDKERFLKIINPISKRSG